MRALLVVIDSFGIGALPDAHLYGDEGANTIRSICTGVKDVRWPVLQRLGLGNCADLLGVDLPGCPTASPPLAGFGVMAEASRGKDTTTGHWELAGVPLEVPFQTFPLACPSFPSELIDTFVKRTGYHILGNKGASGTAIIEELGSEHLKSGRLIVYTSADSVLQIAAHEDIVPLPELYKVCETARDISDTYRIGRVIARPFAGLPGSFVRTANRRDFSMKPPGKTLLDLLKDNGVETIGIGKIGDIFCEQGITRSYHDSGNEACLLRLLDCMGERSDTDQFIFVNLVDTDMHYGHRRDIQGYHDAVARVDERLLKLMGMMGDEDLLIITADHGCDPGFRGSDHTREYVPLLVFSTSSGSENYGIRNSFSDVAASLAVRFGIPGYVEGNSFFDK